ncbi:MAG: type VI secretion system baseplate subunit TssG, partial [Planctomycetota bacterium]
SEERLGTNAGIDDEVVRFRSHPAMEFPAAEVVSIVAGSADEPSSASSVDGGSGKPDMTVAFWGLIGPAGSLPNHYTQLVIDRARQKDSALRDFLDLFGHRQLSLFYRAWAKHFVALGVERAARSEDEGRDQLREVLLSIVGRGTSHVRNRLEATDNTLVYYGGQFVDSPNAESLQAIVADYLGIQVEVISLFGQWLQLPPEEQTRMGTLGGHSSLGVDVVMGGRIWDPGSKFRIRLGPMRRWQFDQLMPTGRDLVPICQLVRSYVGCEFDFDLQAVLVAQDVPACQLGFTPASDTSPDGESGGGAHLGWNTWLVSRKVTRDGDEAVFSHDGWPHG